jgi:hypothetical protein
MPKSTPTIGLVHPELSMCVGEAEADAQSNDPYQTAQPSSSNFELS